MKLCEKCNRPWERLIRGMCKNCYQNFKRRQQAYGRWEGINKHVPAQTVNEHIKKLRAAGIGARRIAELSGITLRTIQSLERRKRCERQTAESILAIPEPLDIFDKHRADGAMVPAIGTARRLRALAAAGYETIELASRLGFKFQYVSYLQLGRGTKVTVRIARIVKDLFEELQMTPGSSDNARRRAVRNGWALPFAWDEDTIDDPDATPFTTWQDEYKRLGEQGMSKTKIAEHLGVHVVTLSHWLKHEGAA